MKNMMDCPFITVKQIDEHLVSYLSRIGHIFTVFDQQDSGCISYGVRAAEQNWFVKYAENHEAIRFMQNAEVFHQAVAHPSIPRLIHAFTTAKGFALVYEWVNGEALGTPAFPGKEGRNRPESPHFRFRQLSTDRIIAALNTVYEVHAYVEQQGYVAVDFYDGGMIYDFDRYELHLCDFDCYRRGAFELEMDRNYGSSRFMAPEEFIRGSLIDHQTNVYTMGAAAFEFLAIGGGRELHDWHAPEALYHVARKAASAERSERYESVYAFYRAWLEAQ
ncbi:protein kinase domain-containing protein [Paenibacillus guangzhouensis]|uniref:protein kinase domain-containing protein n=1 Tax=Paenibacillus guangzhouensis TaxID=1473112 RepID=UPI001266D4AA|nr:protein kinase [Paenibacillus guangzhouensis]